MRQMAQHSATYYSRGKLLCNGDSIGNESGEDVRTVIRGYYGRSMFRQAKVLPVNTVLDLRSFICSQF
jgi:hypothetical protein